jgi:hypothetical protein
MIDDVKVEESAEYDNLLGVKSNPENEPVSLLDFMGLDEEDKKKIVDSTKKEPEWKKHWKGMPDYNQENNAPYRTIYVHFRNEEDYQDFAKKIGQDITSKTKSCWHPKLEIIKNSLMRWIQD